MLGIKLLPLAVAASAVPQVNRRLDNGVGVTPAMGWNGWNVYRCDNAKATLIKQAASQLISLGLSDLGYTYVNVDDCWQNETRDSSGNLAADSDRFPDGMAALAADLHAQGLRLGLYGSAGTLTCEERPGTWGYEAADAALIAGWEVDYWKHDNCYTPCDDGVVETCQNPSGNTSTWFTTMRDALLDQEYPILFSMCQWGRDEVWTWGADVGNSWRMSGDVSNAWAPVKEIAETAAALAQYSAPGGFNDLDMLIVGNGALSEPQERTHFGLWALAKSPLILGTDLSQISNTSLAIISNEAVIAINQDPLGKAAGYFQPSGADDPIDGQLYPYWAGELSDGVVIGLVAVYGETTFELDFADVPGLEVNKTYAWTELWTGETGEGTGVEIDVEKYDMRIYRVTI